MPRDGQAGWASVAVDIVDTLETHQESPSGAGRGDGVIVPLG